MKNGLRSVLKSRSWHKRLRDIGPICLSRSSFPGFLVLLFAVARHGTTSHKSDTRKHDLSMAFSGESHGLLQSVGNHSNRTWFSQGRRILRKVNAVRFVFAA